MISFNNQKIKFTLKNKTLIKQWIVSIIEKNKKKVADINFIFCTDEELLKVNQEYLNHNTYTDIVTFDYCEKEKVSGDIFVSIDRIKENAKIFSKTFEDELHRVMIHGILHLLGNTDKTKQAKAEMRKKEDACLRLLNKHLQK